MEEGKLPPDILDAALARLTAAAPTDARLRLGPGTGRDAAVVEMPDRFLVLASDPISFSGERIGWYAVQVNANDIACLGADPRWFIATILLPPDASEAAVAPIFDDLAAACAEVGATLVGGHTEVTSAVTRPVIVGTMVGEAPIDRLFLSTASEPGDALLQIGPVAVEGTAVLAREAGMKLRDAGLTDAEIREAAALLFDPGISVLPFARTAWTILGLHALHDPTEGGIATACWELASAAGLGVRVFNDEILVHPLTDRIASALGLDWLGLLASGSLLISVADDEAGAALRELHKSGYAAAIIGRMGAAGEPAILEARGRSRSLPRFRRDEVTRVLRDTH